MRTDFVVKTELTDYFYNKIGIKKDSLFCVGCRKPAPINVSVTLSKNCNIIADPRCVVASYKEVVSNSVFDVTVVAHKLNSCRHTDIGFVVYGDADLVDKTTMLTTKVRWGQQTKISDFVTVCGSCSRTLKEVVAEHLKKTCRVSTLDVSFFLESEIQIHNSMVEFKQLPDDAAVPEIYQYDSIIFPV